MKTKSAIAATIAAFFIILALINIDEISSFTKKSIISPQAKVLKNKPLETKPPPISAQDILPNPDLKFEAESILAVNLTKNQIIYQKNPDKKMPIASLAKVMTAVVAYENAIIENIIIIDDHCKVGESEIGLEKGEKLTINELLYGLILPSGNDAAEALAVGITGDRDKFISLMNQKAADLDMSSSYFANPSGLDEKTLSTTTQSTANDLYRLTTYAISFPYLKEIFATDSITFPKNYRRKQYVFNNRLFLHNYFPYIKGIKPGYTNFAGNCLISLAEKQDAQILAIFLNSKDPKNDALTLFNYALK